MRKIEFIVLHCTATDQNFPLQSIQYYWKEVLKWEDPGYHFLIKKNGTIHYLQNIDRPANGVMGYNRNSIHISYLGGIDNIGNSIDNRTVEQKKAQLELLNILQDKFPLARILGHNDFPNVDKDCPCFNVDQWLKKIKFYD